MAQQPNPAAFVAKWSRAELSERAASQEHFIDLCRMLGQPTPAEHDATGAEYTFEKGVAVADTASKGSAGQRGFADAWWRGKFAWEYKRKGKYRDLKEAYRQLCQYREALENPPLLIVSDITRTEIHTNFTGTAKQVHAIDLSELDRPESLDLLRRVFTDPGSFKPTITPEVVTEEVARQSGKLAQRLRDRGHKPHDTAHFLMKCMFCLFAEDVGLLPEHLFERLLASRRVNPDRLPAALTELFGQMRTGGSFGVDDIAHFNGGLFDDAPALDLTPDEIDILLTAARQDWASVEPAIFGTLFERSLDPNTRAQIGAHYTSREDIMLVVEPVVMAPLRREWAGVQAEVEKQLERRRKVNTKKGAADRAIADALQGFVHRLATVRILDPACGSGNFLYVAIQQLLDLEKEVITFAARPDIALGLFPQVRPTQLHGIEINPYAAELAQVVIWIGYLQWMRDNGFIASVRTPILEPLRTIECRDAILDLSDPDHPKPAAWPQADFIIGNPPFLGSKLFRQQGLEDDYIAAMYAAYDLPNSSDLCCYWFELARRAILSHAPTRAGLLATQGIRGGANRTVLDRIKRDGDIFMAWSDREWILDGAAVHVSIVGFDSGLEPTKTGNGIPRENINSDLTFDADTTQARRLGANDALSFMGDTKQGPFDVTWEVARDMLACPNPRAVANTRVVRPWANGLDITRRARSMWIVDFPEVMSDTEASRYEEPFEYIKRHVKPWRVENRKSWYRDEWWVHYAPRPELKRAVAALSRYIVSPRVTKHRLFVWTNGRTVPDCQLIVFARSDDYFFGVLHSAVHELWARRMGTQLREAESGFRYTPTTCFETFPLPWSPGEEPVAQPPSAGETPGEGRSSIPHPGATDAHPGAGVPQVAQPPSAGEDRSSMPHLGTTESHPGAGVPQVAQPPSAGETPGKDRSSIPHPGATEAHLGTTESHPGAGVPQVGQPPSAGAMPAGEAGAKEALSHYRRNLPHIQPGHRPVFVTFCTRDRWVLPETARTLVLEHCLYDHGTKLHMHGLVVMPDHVHLVFTPLLDSAGTPFGLAEIMNGIKGASAHRINKVLKRRGSVWQDESFDHVMRRHEAVERKVDYICNNPVRKGLASSEDDYPWLWREWVDDVPHPGAGVPQVAQPPSAGETPGEDRPPIPHPGAREAHPGAGVPHVLHGAISEAAKELNELRERWLNPPEWIEPIARAVDADDDFAEVPDEARELIRQSAIMARAAKDKNLKQRTLTNLYNERPTWLRIAHERLDRAVLSAYAAVDPEGDWSPDWAEVWIETGAGQPLPDDHALFARRAEVDQLVLANLLRMNLSRAAHS